MATKKKSGVIKIDMRKEEGGGGGGIRLPEDDYRVKVTKVKAVRSSEKETPGLEVGFKIVEGKYKGREFTDRLWLVPKALWRVRALLEALGLEVPKKVISIPTKKLVGQELGVTLSDEEYEGRVRSRVSDFLDADLIGEEDEDEDEDDLEDDDDLEDEDEDDDEEEEEEDDEDDEEEEEEEEKPRKKRRRKKPAKKAKGSRKRRKRDDDDDEDEEDEDDDDDLEELDLDDL